MTLNWFSILPTARPPLSEEMICLGESLPLVSVLVPSYNHARYIETCVKSIGEQTYENIELVIVDDGSRDASPDILRQLRCERKLVRSLRARNIGLIGTLNEALSLASGEFVAIIASDDFWAPTKIESQVHRLLADEDLKLVFTEGVEVDEFNNPIGPVCYTRRNLQRWTFDDVLLKADLPPASIMFRRKDVLDRGGLSDKFKIEDLPLWLSLLREGGYAAVVKEPLAFYRSHPQNMHTVQSNMVLMQHLEIIEHFSQGRPDRPKVLREWSLRTANFVAREDKKLALRHFLRSCYMVWDWRFYSTIFKLFCKWPSGVKLR